MKFLRFGDKGQERPGCLDASGRVRDLSGVAADFGGEGVAITALDRLRAIDPETLPLAPEGARIGCALAFVPNFWAVGLNYARHAQEAGMAIPQEPILFTKATGCLSGPHDPVILPKDSVKSDWEVELGIVIGRDAYHVTETEAPGCVSAYCLINDVSEREFQIERGGQWVKGKSAPTFGPVGPWLVTPDELGDPQAIPLGMSLNGAVQQDSSTADMIFGVAQIVSYMSRFIALRPGDIIATGTPEGVGMGQKPQRFLRPGDVMELWAEGLGRQRQEVVAFPG
ncbi:fumarylacetoacetate hydrolase family protein [Halovulum dunhuangense]|uniref:Fumarylacetoacetate hydrolase family protein n=1 Tax=Halovulum dunhuangense TaxID=1505036 RepID=A0A849L486_9RHOB|nr:fumarylacetoacetate hydrolase family protein [Halovulum dunhuangense]NNU81166.1 fumarylacetoacetate hydrolase family protein [Halovulum dunhuangense]